MTKGLLICVAALLVLVIAAMVRQHAFYAEVRRSAAQDHQSAVYSAGSFHAVTFLKSSLAVPSADQTMAELRAFKSATENLGDAKWIYAGKVVENGQGSEQLGDIGWTATALVQYPSKDAYLKAIATSAYQDALAAFDTHYTHGAHRPVLRNLLFPQMMLLTRVIKGFGSVDGYPFEPADTARLPDQFHTIVAKLRAERELGKDGMVVFNLQKQGTPEQQAADAKYVAPMIALMAQLGYGPMHFATADPLPGNRDFENVAIVFYPGTDFFADMIGSNFYQNIFGDKQLGDNQSTITVPVLDLL